MSESAHRLTDTVRDWLHRDPETDEKADTETNPDPDLGELDRMDDEVEDQPTA